MWGKFFNKTEREVKNGSNKKDESLLNKDTVSLTEVRSLGQKARKIG